MQGHPIVAHRGGYPYQDSNTIVRFDKAMRAGADVMEMDLRLSRDGTVFVFHDKDLRYATNCTGSFETFTAAEIDRCHLNGLETGPDRFERVLEWSQGRAVLDAELKTNEVVRPAIDLIRRYDAYEWVYFQVRNGLDLYRAVRAYDTRVALEAAPVGIHAELYLDQLLAQNDPRLMIIQLHADTLNPLNLDMLRGLGKLTSMDAWRAGSERGWSFSSMFRSAACEDVWSHGVDIAITNDPGDCRKQRDQLGP